MENFFRPIKDAMDDRTLAWEEKRCVLSPIGCGLSVAAPDHFRDEISKKEYTISGLCQACQDSVFKDVEDEYWVCGDCGDSGHGTHACQAYLDDLDL